MFIQKHITAKWLLLVMVLSVFIGVPQNAFAGSSLFATAVSKIEVDSTEIYQGDEINVKVYLNGPAKKVKLSDTTSFKSSVGETYSAADTDKGDSVFNLKLVYTGVGNELKLNIVPLTDNTVGTYAPFDATLIVKGVQRSTSQTVAVDVFKVTKSSTLREIPAGTDVPITVPVETTTSMAGKTVTATIISPTDESLFSKEDSTLVSTVDGFGTKNTGTANFRLFIQPSAKSKTYEIKLKLSYTNTSGVIFNDETANSYYVKVKNSNIEPTISVVDYNTKAKAVTAGKTDQLTLAIQNTGTIAGSDIRVKLTGFDKDKIKLSNDVDTKSIDSIAGAGKTSVTFNIAAAAAAKTDTQELTAEISYIDDGGKDYKTTSKIYLPIEGKDLSAIELRVLNLKMPERTKAKQSFDIAFDVKNVSNLDASSVEIGMEYSNTTFIPKSTPKKFVRTFKAGETRHYVFSFTSKEDALTGFYDLYATIKYNIEGGKDTDAQTYKEFAGIYLDGALGLGRPKVIIQNYNFGGQNALAGKDFDLTMDLFNTSSDESIKNIKVSLKADDGIFSPVDMSSSFFVPEIGAQQTLSKTIKLKTKPDAAVKTYNLVVTFMYEDSKGNAYDAQKNPFKEEETIAIPVSQPVRLETSEVTLPQEIYLNQPTTVSMEFFNMGKSTIYNLMVKASGDFQVQGSNYFVGNFDAGRSDYFETTVMPTKEGECVGKVEFMFEDANGVPGVITKELKLNVMAAPPVVDPTNPNGGDPNNPGGGVNPDGTPIQPWYQNKLILGGIAALVLAAAGGGIFLRRRAKKKAALRLEDDDE